MATHKKTDQNASLKPGSSATDAAKVGGKGDFGVPESDVVGRTYTSRNTKASDPGAAQPHGGENDNRTTGVGGTGSGVGSSSGGDLDTDFVGIRTDPLPAGHPDLTARPERVKGTTHQLPDEQTLEGGADDASLAEGDSDSFAGEVSSGEASGQDNRTAND